MQIWQFAILGLGTGAVFALFAHSIVAVNLGSGVLNFSAGAIGMVGAYTYYALYGTSTLSSVAALAVALTVSAAIGVAMYWLVMRRLANAPHTSRIVATLGLMAILLEGVTLFSEGKGAAQLVRSPLPRGVVRLGADMSVGQDRLMLTAIAIVATLALMAAERHTRLGLAARAVSENRTVVASMGWSPDLVAATAWAVGSVLAAVAAILAASMSSLNASGLTLLVVPAMAAALLGGFHSFGWTLGGAMLLGVAQSLVSRYVSAPGWQTAGPLLAIVVILAARGHRLPARTEHAERRPAVGTGSIRKGVFVVAAVAAGLIFAVPVTWLNAISITLLFALIILSVVVLTGYAGQLSLAQAALAALGAYFTAWFAVVGGLPLSIAIVCGVAVCSPIAVLVALPALRTRGPNLAIATLSLAIAIDSLVINNPQRVAVLAAEPLGRLNLFGVDVNGVTRPAAFAVVALGVLVIAGLAVANLRRGRAGRRLLAVRSNERAAAALGISVAGIKLYAFWLSTMIAATAGALLEARFAFGDLSLFNVLDNINVVLYATVGGIGWIASSAIGALNVPGGISALILSSFTTSAGAWLVLIGGVGAITVVLQSPDGMAPLMRHQLEGIVTFVRRLARIRRQPPQAVSVPARAAFGRVESRRLEVRDVTVQFGYQTALDGVCLTLGPGEVVGLIGPNGAGKSTLIDVVTGFQSPKSGSVLVDGRPIDRLTPARRARAGLSRSFQSLELFDDMSVLENLRTAGDRTSARHYLTDLVWPRADAVSDATAAAIYEFRLQDVLGAVPPQLDYGKRRLVAIARAMSSAPSLLLLDEPAAGLDERERRELAHLIRRVADEWGIGVLLVEHDVQLVFSVSDRVVALDQGAVIASGTCDEVRRSRAVVSAYLGGVDADAGTSPSEAGHTGNPHEARW